MQRYEMYIFRFISEIWNTNISQDIRGLLVYKEFTRQLWSLSINLDVELITVIKSIVLPK